MLKIVSKSNILVLLLVKNLPIQIMTTWRLPRVVTADLKKTAYFYQMYSQMAATVSKHCDFFVYTKYEFHLERVRYFT